jgi:hypothetical protein
MSWRNPKKQKEKRKKKKERKKSKSTLLATNPYQRRFRSASALS